ncbi:MAG: hypothetical protein M3Y32_12210 [Pseudomonadota bacterium]|nr:hypothetical protein [Pseudomonadota bacterium]
MAIQANATVVAASDNRRRDAVGGGWMRRLPSQARFIAMRSDERLLVIA